MNKGKVLRLFLFFIIYILIGAFIILKFPTNESYYYNYLILAVSYFIIVGMLLIIYEIKGLYIFEPIVLITFLYLAIFCITPIINIVNNTTSFLGIDIMMGGVKATFIFLISYLAFFIGYYLQKNTNIKPENKIYEQPNEISKEFATKISLFIWIICYIFTLIYIGASGKSIAYILSAGMAGNVDYNNQFGTPVGFLVFFSYSLIPTWLYICIYGKNKLLKITLGVLTLISYVVCGFRFIIIILIMAPIVQYYIRRNKSPKSITLAVLLLLIFLMIGTLGFVRDNIRVGTSIAWDNFSCQFIWEAVKGNFEIYMPFYGLVEAVPAKHGYTLGQQLSYTVIMFIPRALWPTKPTPIIKDLTALSVSDYAAQAGVAWPNIGEFYSEFGILGCIIFMFIFGKVCGWCKKLYQNQKRNDHDLITYSIILPAVLQLVIRGYTPSNFYLMLFLLLPIILIKRLAKTR